jgi:two-component system NtrC family sensor kinase
VFPIVTAQGQYRLGSSTRDVTRQKQIEAALRDSEVRYRLITENMSDGVWLLDMQLNATYISPAVWHALGYRVEEIKQRMRYGQILTAASRRTLFRFLKQALTQENLQRPADNLSQTLELELYRRDGSTLWSEVTLTLIRDDDGKPGGILAVGRDITERKRAAERVLRLTDDLSQRARELAALNNASRALTSSLELKRVLAAIIREIQELLKADRAAVLLRDATSDDLVFAAAAGENSEKLIGTRLSINRGIAGWVARERRSALVQEAYQDPRFWSSTDARTGYLTRSVVAVPIKYLGAVWGVIEAINKRDGVFSERDREMLEALAGSAAIALENARLYQAEREQTHRLKESQTRLIHAEKMSALGRLAASLTHEINNPLQAIHSGLGLMQTELSENADPADLLRDLQIIDREVKRISDLMLRLREFSRPVELETRPTDLHALFDTILSLTGKQMQRNHIQVKTAWDPTVPPIMASPDQLTQVFMNLVLNAIDAMPNGGLLTISTAADRSRVDFPMIRIDVTDTGCGISPQALPRIFEPFFTTKQDGTGLGLAISFEIVKSLGGEITVASRLGAGTTFTVMLPLREF